MNTTITKVGKISPLDRIVLSGIVYKVNSILPGYNCVELGCRPIEGGARIIYSDRWDAPIIKVLTEEAEPSEDRKFAPCHAGDLKEGDRVMYCGQERVVHSVEYVPEQELHLITYVLPNNPNPNETGTHVWGHRQDRFLRIQEPKTLQQMLEENGWELIQTGGNCTAYRLGIDEAHFLLMTDGNASAPKSASERVLVCFCETVLVGDHESDKELLNLWVGLDDYLKGSIEIEAGGGLL